MPILGHQYTSFLEAPRPAALISCYKTLENAIKQLLHFQDVSSCAWVHYYMMWET